MSDVHQALAPEVLARLSIRIHVERHRRGITMKALAAAVGCVESLVCRWEHRTACPSLAMLCRVADALGVTVGYLVDP